MLQNDTGVQKNKCGTWKIQRNKKVTNPNVDRVEATFDGTKLFEEMLSRNWFMTKKLFLCYNQKSILWIQQRGN